MNDSCARPPGGPRELHASQQRQVGRGSCNFLRSLDNPARERDGLGWPSANMRGGGLAVDDSDTDEAALG